MAVRRSYEQKLRDDLNDLPANKWFKIAGRADYDKFVVAVKMLIDAGESFLFSNDYGMVRREDFTPYTSVTVWHKAKESELPTGMTIEKISRGQEVTIEVKGRNYTHKMERNCYHIYINDKFIGTEI